MTALHLLSDLREEGVTFALKGAEVLILTLPQGQQLHALPVPGRPWAIGLVAAVQQYDHFVQLLTDCARIPREAEVFAWQLLLASHTPMERDDT